MLLHRLLATQHELPFDSVIAGNPGWYTLPTLERDFPEGVGGLGFDVGEPDSLLYCCETTLELELPPRPVEAARAVDARHAEIP